MDGLLTRLGPTGSSDEPFEVCQSALLERWISLSPLGFPITLLTIMVLHITSHRKRMDAKAVLVMSVKESVLE